jgi:hypothetical protein
MKSIVLMLMVIAGCSGNSAAPVPAPVTITAGQVFNASMIGQTWTFQNGYGDVSTIDIQAAAFCEAGICDGKSVVMHFAKTVCRSYWQPGVCGAELWFVIHLEADGSYRAIASKVKFPQGCPYSLCVPSTAPTLTTQNPQLIAGMPLPYTVIPAKGMEGQSATVKTAYTSFWQIGALTDDAVTPNFPVTQVPWSTTSRVQQITTPVTGPVKALMSEQREGLVHEIWYAVPGVGFVEFSPLDFGDGKGLDPLLTMKRIR